MADKDNTEQCLDDIMAETDLGPEDEMTLDERVEEGDDIVALKTEIAELKDGYMRALADAQVDGAARLAWAEHGIQLPALGRGATVFALRRL